MSAPTPPGPEEHAPGPEEHGRHAAGQPRRSGLGAVLAEDEFSVSDAIGGPRGILESVLPTLLFVVLFVATRSVKLAALSAVAVVLVLLVARLVQRQSPGTVLGGLIGVALGAVLAIRSGDGTDFYWPGIVINAVSLAVLLLTLALRRPLVGIVVALLDPRVQDWQEDPDARRVYACFEQPDLKARFTFSVVAPSSWTVVSGGAVVGQEADGEGFTLTRFAETLADRSS